jgi:hypothetical protein
MPEIYIYIYRGEMAGLEKESNWKACYRMANVIGSRPKSGKGKK